MEKPSSLNTIENVGQVYEIIKYLDLSQNIKIKLFAWDLGINIEQSSHAQRADFTYKKLWKRLDKKNDLDLSQNFETIFVKSGIGYITTNSKATYKI